MRIIRVLMVALAAALMTAPNAFAALKSNDAAPALSLPDLDGAPFDLAGLLRGGGGRPPGGVVLGFFATWCGPCRNELPLLDRLAEELKGRGVTVVVVDLKEDPSAVRRFLSELRIRNLIVLSDRAGEAAERYQVRFLPVTFCIGADGTIKDMIYGEVRNADELRRCAEKLLK